MDVYQSSLLSRSISIPMMQMGGNVKSLLEEELRTFEGKCVEEGYIKKNSIEIFNYSCGVIKGRNVIVQVVFTCKIANPLPGQLLYCIVETNTRAGIKAKLQSKDDSPFIVFLARDHHNLNPSFSDIKENEKIKVSILGQRFEINDPKISVIAMLVDSTVTDAEVPEVPEVPEPEEPEHVEVKVKKTKETKSKVTKAKEAKDTDVNVEDTFVFYSKSADKPPGKGTGEHGNPKNYPELAKKVEWRKQLSHFDESEFECDGSHEDNIVFPPGSKWKTLEHYWQACKLSLADKPFANLLRLGEKYGNGNGLQARELRKGIAKGPDKHPVILSEEQLKRWNEIQPRVMYIGAKAKFSQNDEKLKLLCATKKAKLLHSPGRGGEIVHFTHYEKVREELCSNESN